MRFRELESELSLTKQRLQSLIEAYESSQEEMKASNEELQSTNEELRSTMEELETGKEELQSMNEELQAVNQENRHRVEELTLLSNDLQNLMAATDIATLFLDRELRILRTTPKVAELFNVRTTDRGRPISDLTHRLGDVELTPDAERVLKGLVPVEREICDEAGNWYLTRVLPYRSGDDRIDGVVITFVDITDRKRAEKEVAAAKEFAENIVETLHEPLLVLDPDLRVKSANPAFYKHFQVDQNATIGRKFYDLGNGQWDIAALRNLLENVLPTNNAFNDFELHYDFEDSSRHTMLVNGRRLDHVQLILLGIRDITERKQAEQLLQESKNELERRVAERTAELQRQNQLLRQIAAQLTEAEQREREKLAKTLHDGLQQILVSCKMHLSSSDGKDFAQTARYVMTLIDQALQVSRTLSYELRPPTLQSFNLPEVFHWLAGQMRTNHLFEVEVHVEPEFPPVPDNLKVFLFTAVRELLLNSVKHSGTDAARVYLKLEERPVRQIRITVADEGQGFDPERIEIEGEELHGFGLFSLRERLNAMGGTFQVESAPGHGATFTITAPLNDEELDCEPIETVTVDAPAAPLALPAPSGNSIRVLIVDDHAIFRQGLIALIEHHPEIELVGEARDGIEAVERIGELGPDVVLMDVNMPRMNGIEATREIKRRYPEIVVIGLSFHEAQDMAAAMHRAGASAYLRKGDDAKALVATIRNLRETKDS